MQVPTKTPDIVAVLDIGSSKVSCLIGRYKQDVGVSVLGAGYHASAGLKTGAVIDMEQAEYTIRHAVEKAERAAGLAISTVIVNVSTRSLQSKHVKVETKFASAEVADRDLKRLVDTALMEFSQPEHAVLHALPMNWSVDAERGVKDPRGMYGRRLGVEMHFVTAGLGVLRNLSHAVERCHLRIAKMVASPYAAGLGVLVDDELDLGVTVIDMGGGITTAAVFRDRVLAYVDAVPVGGQNVTADIARGLTTPWEAAERIKTIYGSALESPSDDQQMVPCPPMGAQDELHNEPLSLLTRCVRSRLEETFEILRDRFKEAGIEEYSGRRIVLTGGAAQLAGVAQLAEFIFKKRVRVGQPHGLFGLDDDMSGPGFAVTAGLIKGGFAHSSDKIIGTPDLTGRRMRKRRHAGGHIGRSLRWFKENF
ncbi:MAG TPA: cell division protein FtsA [Hellea balneolensis]|uniref:Cell division protein FtsA n=1 Tax=Hellea balneolensis TaxID=287478 RepID=A0A7C5LRL3_9PROT|nr:cell division protein FtsA [Hellea balneolensis]